MPLIMRPALRSEPINKNIGVGSGPDAIDRLPKAQPAKSIVIKSNKHVCQAVFFPFWVVWGEGVGRLNIRLRRDTCELSPHVPKHIIQIWHSEHYSRGGEKEPGRGPLYTVKIQTPSFCSFCLVHKLGVFCVGRESSLCPTPI
jgi:hypothetical protein